jgi:hypothetical protein
MNQVPQERKTTMQERTVAIVPGSPSLDFDQARQDREPNTHSGNRGGRTPDPFEAKQREERVMEEGHVDQEDPEMQNPNPRLNLQHPAHRTGHLPAKPPDGFRERKVRENDRAEHQDANRDFRRGSPQTRPVAFERQLEKIGSDQCRKHHNRELPYPECRPDDDRHS